MKKLFKNAKNSNFINEKEFFKRYRIILRNWGAFRSLSPRLKQVLIYRYDLKNNIGNFMSASEIAKKFKVSKKSIKNWEKKAFKLITKKGKYNV